MSITVRKSYSTVKRLNDKLDLGALCKKACSGEERAFFDV